MKHRTIILIAGMLMAIGIHAQSLWDASKPDNDITFGIRAGLNFASTDMNSATSTRTGVHLGGNVDWNIIKSFSVTSGLSYVEKGFRSQFGKGSAGYVQIPLLASWRIETPTGVRFHFNIGPYYAYGISGTIDYAPYDQTFAYSFTQDAFGKKGFFKNNDLGATAGLFIQIKQIVAGVSYEYGLSDIARVYGKFHNRNVNFTAGYNF